jgi:hypothetical protein
MRLPVLNEVWQENRQRGTRCHAVQENTAAHGEVRRRKCIIVRQSRTLLLSFSKRYCILDTTGPAPQALGRTAMDLEGS